MWKSSLEAIDSWTESMMKGLGMTEFIMWERSRVQMELGVKVQALQWDHCNTQEQNI